MQVTAMGKEPQVTNENVPTVYDSGSAPEPALSQTYIEPQYPHSAPMMFVQMGGDTYIYNPLTGKKVGIVTYQSPPNPFNTKIGLQITVFAEAIEMTPLPAVKAKQKYAPYEEMMSTKHLHKLGIDTSPGTMVKTSEPFFDMDGVQYGYNSHWNGPKPSSPVTPSPLPMKMLEPEADSEPPKKSGGLSFLEQVIGGVFHNGSSPLLGDILTDIKEMTIQDVNWTPTKVPSFEWTKFSDYDGIKVGIKVTNQNIYADYKPEPPDEPMRGLEEIWKQAII